MTLFHPRLLLACALLPAFAVMAAPAVPGMDEGAQAHAHSPRHGGCETFTWDVSRELAAMDGPAVDIVSARSAPGSARIEPGVRHDVALHPQSGVRLLAEPPRKPPEGATAGHVVFQVPAPGRYRVAITTRHWIDVFDAGTALATIGHEGRPGCPAMRKVVELDLPAGRDLVLQVDSGQGDTVGVLVNRAEVEQAKP